MWKSSDNSTKEKAKLRLVNCQTFYSQQFAISSSKCSLSLVEIVSVDDPKGHRLRLNWCLLESVLLIQ